VTRWMMEKRVLASEKVALVSIRRDSWQLRNNKYLFGQYVHLCESQRIDVRYDLLNESFPSSRLSYSSDPVKPNIIWISSCCSGIEQSRVYMSRVNVPRNGYFIHDIIWKYEFDTNSKCDCKVHESVRSSLVWNSNKWLLHFIWESHGGHSCTTEDSSLVFRNTPQYFCVINDYDLD
jgi:hypothetical protein